MIEAAGDQSIDHLTTIFNQIMYDKVIPVEWRLSYVIKRGCPIERKLQKFEIARTSHEGS